MSSRLRILILNGPNLQLLGTREPEVYGSTTLAQLEKKLYQSAAKLGVDIDCRQSNHEGQLLDWIGQAPGDFAGILLNAGAYTHTSIALRDAIAGTAMPVCEVHMSNIMARESFRQQTMLGGVCIGMVTGFGVNSYILGLQALVHWLQTNDASIES